MSRILFVLLAVVSAQSAAFADGCLVYTRNDGVPGYVEITDVGTNFTFVLVSKKFATRVESTEQKTGYFDFIRQEMVKFSDNRFFVFTTRGLGEFWIGTEINADGTASDFELVLDSKTACGQEPV